MRIRLLVFLISISLFGCDKQAEPVEAIAAADAPAEQKDSRTDLEIIMDNIDEVLSVEEARALYLKGCNANTNRIARECDCLVKYFEEHLPEPLFDLESAWEAGEGDLIASMNNALLAVDFNYLEYSAETKKSAWDACLEGIPVT